MGYYGSFFAPYVSVAEKRERALKAIEKLRKKNPDIEPVIIQGRTISSTWWGKSWTKNLESYSDYANRMGRGRSYVRNNAVIDLKIKLGLVTSMVQGSDKKPYNINITIKPIESSEWKGIVKECEGKLDSLEELLKGKFPKALSEFFTSKGNGLFPSPKEITLQCNCPDYATMCKHVAATLYAVGAKLDNNPSLFFELRNINVEDLISETTISKSKTLVEKSKKKSGRVIENTDISDLFGIDIEENKESKEQTKVAKNTNVKSKNTNVKSKTSKVKSNTTVKKSGKSTSKKTSK
jgi:uncharacterized Zn finger protein